MLTKVFRIELTGGKDVEKDLISIKTAMSAMANAISKAKGELAALVDTKADPGAISSLTGKIADLEAKLKSLSQERKKAETDAKTEAQVEKLLAETKLKEAQATKAQEEATKVRIASQIAQEKELDRQIEKERKEQQELEKKKKILDGLPGSYNAIRNALNELRPLIQKGNESANINFQGQNLTFEQAIAEYKRLSATEQEFRRQFTRDSTLVGEYATGIVDAFKRLNIDDIIKNQVTGAKQQLEQLETKTQQLVVAYRQAQQEGSQDLNKLEKEIHENVVETENLKKAVAGAEVQLKGIGGVGEQITGSINKGFKDLKNSISQFALSYIGFQAVFSSLQSGIDNAKELSDQTTNLEIELGKAKGGAQGLVDELAKLDTRTKLQGLEEIANIAAKAGVGEKQLVGVTQAIDKIKIAFGKDFGDVEQGTESLVKLTNIFLGPGAVTGDNLLKMGNAIRTLANESVASVPFLNDFSKRMAGLKGIADISLPSVLGLASGFEQFGQNAEVSSTALVKIIPKLAEDTEKFSKIAGVTREEFSKLLKNNPAEALLKVSEGLVKGKGSLEEFAAAFKDTELGTGRVESVIGVLGKNTEQFRKSIDSAGQAFNDTANIETAFAAKNDNLAATLDKIGKRFADAAGGKVFQSTLLAIATIVTVLLNNLPILLVLGGLLATNWAVQNAQLILLNAQVLGYNIAIGASYVALGVLTIAQTAYNVVLFITNGAISIGTRLLSLFGITVKATTGPLGVILTVVSLLAAAFAAFGRRLEDSRQSLSEHIRLQQINAEISREAIKATSDQISSLDGWIAVVKSAATSADTKRKAMEKLIQINPAFRNALQGETIDLNELDKAYGKVVQQIQAKARAEAAATLSAGKQRKVAEIAGLRQDLEIQFAQKNKRGQSVFDVELTDEQKKILQQGDFLNTGAITTFRDNGAQVFASRFDQIKKFLDKKEREAISVYQDYLKAQAQAEENLTKAEEQVQKTPAIEPTETVFQVFDRLLKNDGTGSDFKALLKKIQEQKKITAVTSKEYQDLLALEKKVRELIKPKSGSGGSRSPEKQKLDDQIKLIDATTTEKKNALDEQLAQGVISERDYYTQVRDITVNGEQQKINIIQEFQRKYKVALAKYNGELTKDISDAEKKQLQAKRDANQKLFDIDNKQLEINLRNEQVSAERNKDTSLLNPDLSNEDRLQSTIDYYDRLLLAQVIFNQKQSELEKKYGIKSAENEQKRKEEIEKIRRGLEDSEKQRPEARQKDIQAAADRQLAEIRRRVADRTIAILESGKSYTKKARELAKLEHDATKDQLAEEAAAAKRALEQAEGDRKKGLISEKDYLEKLEVYKTKEAALYKYTTDEQVSATQRFINALKELKDSFVETVIGIKKYTDDAEGEQQRTYDAVAQTRNTIKELINNAYQSYFKHQEEKIDRDKKEHQDTLDREKERVLARATSEAEKNTIERQYAQKQKDIDKKAAEDKRKLSIKQATIDFAVAVIKTFAQFGFPLGLIPVAALTAAYIFQRSQIQKQQFGKGGNLKQRQFGLGGNANEVPVNGGVFGGKPHTQGGTDFSFNGQAYNAEVGEMNIIRTKDAPKNKTYTITGNHTQIASALNSLGGGVPFQPGAKVSKYGMGGTLGTQLKAPYFSAGAYLNGGNVSGSNNNDRIERLEAMTEQVLAAVYATDSKEVQLNPVKVTKAQRKKIKDTTVGDI
jgi:hypothetical protein